MTVPRAGKKPSFPVYCKLIIKNTHFISELTLNKFHLYVTHEQQTRHWLDTEKHALSPVLKLDSPENEEYLQIREEKMNEASYKTENWTCILIKIVRSDSLAGQGRWWLWTQAGSSQRMDFSLHWLCVCTTLTCPITLTVPWVWYLGLWILN